VGGAAQADVPSPVLGDVALSSSPDFFSTARKRISLAFKINVILALTLSFILFGGIVLSIGGALTGRSPRSLQQS
jgi:hypothetical protein